MTKQSATLTAFAEDVLTGLSAPKRSLSSKWFYDETGSDLFRQIMAQPEYYLTDAELDIYRRIGPRLAGELDDRPFDLVELGAGDGTKTQHLIEYFLAQGRDFRYLPIDISRDALDGLGELIHLRWPNLDFHPIAADYFVALDELDLGEDRQRLLLFPGANIGNFSPAFATAMMRRVRGLLRKDDLVLTGFDLMKDPATILAAYNDAAGKTAAFNLNLLYRINRELGGNFDPARWRHWETYNPVTGAAQSFLVSQGTQRVTIEALDRNFEFAAWEAIDVEISQKYNRAQIEEMAERAGYRFRWCFEDERNYFVDALWRV